MEEGRGERGGMEKKRGRPLKAERFRRDSMSSIGSLGESLESLWWNKRKGRGEEEERELDENVFKKSAKISRSPLKKSRESERCGEEKKEIREREERGKQG